MDNSRIKAFVSSSKEAGIECRIYSCYPTRFSRKLTSQVSNWEGVPVSYFSKSNLYKGNRLGRLLQIMRGVAGCTWFCTKSRSQFDYVVFSCPRFVDSAAGLLMHSILGGSVVVDQTELFSTGGNAWIHRLEERIIAKRSHVLFAISAPLKNHYQAKFNKTAYILPPVVDLDRFSKNPKAEQHTIGYLGSFGLKDDIEFVLRAFEISCKGSDLNLKLKLLGSPNNPPKLKELVQQSSVSDRITLTINPTANQVNSLLPLCDTFIMNRTNSEFSKYGYPTKLGEYLACKRPVLMSNGPGFSEDFTHLMQAIKYDVDNPQALADAIIWRYGNPELAEEIAQRGYDYAKKHFSTSVVGKIFISHLQQRET